MYKNDRSLLAEAYELVQLNELFDNPFNYKEWGSWEERRVAVTKYEFSISEPDEKGVVPSFPKYIVTLALNVEEYTLDIEFAYHATKDTYDMKLTGTGNASRVLATVMAIIKKYINESIENYGIEACKLFTIEFSGKASEESRINLYDQFAKFFTSFLKAKTGILWEWDAYTASGNKLYRIEAKRINSDENEANPKVRSSFEKFL